VTPANAARAAIEAVWRIESPRLIAALARMVRDVGLAEELAQDAFVAALEQWPADGVPDRPGAWLMQAAKRRAIDQLRRAERLRRKQEVVGRDAEAAEELAAADFEAALTEEIGDSLLRLVFTACHPVLAPEARVALTLRLLCGLTTEEIARAFLVPVATMAQRIVRAKRTLAEARVAFEVPAGPDLAPRLGAVLAMVYLVFNDGGRARFRRMQPRGSNSVPSPRPRASTLRCLYISASVTREVRAVAAHEAPSQPANGIRTATFATVGDDRSCGSGRSEYHLSDRNV
jgi:RNA polymerase sigma factor (sigma-70 family)